MNESGGFTCEINIFCRTPDGYDAHIKSTEVASDEVIGALTALSGRLAAEGFTFKGVGESVRPAEAVPFEEPSKPKPWTQPPPPNANAGVPVCAYCGGQVWDNRKNKHSEKAPDFKCKDKDHCGAAAWVNGDDVKWAPPTAG